MACLKGTMAVLKFTLRNVPFVFTEQTFIILRGQRQYLEMENLQFNKVHSKPLSTCYLLTKTICNK